MLTRMTPEEFEADLTLSLGNPCARRRLNRAGFRATTFSVTRKTMGRRMFSRGRGLCYDSSVFPIGFHPDYGMGTPRSDRINPKRHLGSCP
jgi:hypothetical protein